MVLSVTFRCRYDNTTICFHQNCRDCPMRLDELMHIKTELEERIRPSREIICRNHRVAMLAQTDKKRRCQQCPGSIFPQDYYYRITSTLNGNYIADCHPECLDKLFSVQDKIA